MRRPWFKPSRIAGIGCLVLAILVPTLPSCAVQKRQPFAVAASSVAPVATQQPRAARGSCDLPTGDVRRLAEDLLANRYRLARFPVYTVPGNPHWNENPAHDTNWEFNFHTLRFVEILWRAYDATHDRRFLDRSEFILRDWYRDNPRANPPSPYSWNDHSTAWRGIIYACALERLPGRSWLRAAALLHARLLASERFYRKHGNHALNQSIGLLTLGCVMHRPAWRSIAERRIERLVVESVDAQGVTNEQSIGYQYYNYSRYSAAIENLRACGMKPSRVLTSRIVRMPAFMAYAVLPNGEWELVGDTVKGGLPGLAHPASPYAVFDAGFAFLRSGWGATRPLADETAISVRFGPGRDLHGHTDAVSLTLFANGDRILLDPGMYHYGADPWRTWFRSGPAHNTIDVAGSPMHAGGETCLLAERHTSDFDFLVLEHHKISGVDHRRRVLYSRRLGVMLVEDDVWASSPRTVRQWWHLHPEARPAFSAGGFFTGRPGSPSNAWVVQLDGGGKQRAVTGALDPIQGWVSFDYGQRVPAPAVSVTKTGTRVRFFTLIVPQPERAPSWTVRAFRPASVGFDLTLQIGAAAERFVVRGESATERRA